MIFWWYLKALTPFGFSRFLLGVSRPLYLSNHSLIFGEYYYELFHGRRWIIRDIIIKERAQKSHLKSILIYVLWRKTPQIVLSNRKPVIFKIVHKTKMSHTSVMVIWKRKDLDLKPQNCNPTFRFEDSRIDPHYLPTFWVCDCYYFFISKTGCREQNLFRVSISDR